jgi:signal peptidase I
MGTRRGSPRPAPARLAGGPGIRYDRAVHDREVWVSEQTPPAEADEPLDPAIDDEEPEEEPRSPGRWIWELAKTWGPAILAIIIIRTFIFQPFNIPSTSMVPTLLIGDHVIVTKYSYGLWFPNPTNYDRYEVWDYADPARGDIIVFRFPLDKSTHYIKRVVGLPGDTIEVRDNQIVVNGKVQLRTEAGRYTYEDADCDRPREAKLWTEQLGSVAHAKLTDDSPKSLAYHSALTVPPGKVFVMGDNRDNSGDSRQWGYVDEELIMGKAHFVWVSFDSCGSGFPPPLRWERMGLGLYRPIKANIAE